MSLILFLHVSGQPVEQRHENDVIEFSAMLSFGKNVGRESCNFYPSAKKPPTNTKKQKKRHPPQISPCIVLRIPASKYEFVLRTFSHINRRSESQCSFGNLKKKTYQLRFLLFYNCTNLQREQIAVGCRVLSSAKLKKSNKSVL